MKIRTGFVTNSSSSLFTIIGQNAIHDTRLLHPTEKDLKRFDEDTENDSEMRYLKDWQIDIDHENDSVSFSTYLDNFQYDEYAEYLGYRIKGGK